MAASRSARQLAEIGRFIEGLYELGGYRTWKEFGDEAKISQSQVSDFKNGSVEPSGYNLLRLIQAAATRATEEITETVRLAVAPRIGAGANLEDDHLAEIAETLKILAHNQALALDALDVSEDVRRTLEPPDEPPEAHPKPNR